MKIHQILSFFHFSEILNQFYIVFNNRVVGPEAFAIVKSESRHMALFNKLREFGSLILVLEPQ